MLYSAGGAEVAELADAQDLGSCGRKVVGVQIPPSAPIIVIRNSASMLNDLSTEKENKARPAKYILIALAGAAILAASFLCDHFVEQFVVQHRNPELLHAAREISRYGEWFYLVLPALLIWGAGRFPEESAMEKIGPGIGALCLHRRTRRHYDSIQHRPDAPFGHGPARMVRNSPRRRVVAGKISIQFVSVGPHGFRDGIWRGAFSGHAALENSRGADSRADRMVAHLSGSASLFGCCRVGAARLAVGIYTWYRLVPRLLKN